MTEKKLKKEKVKIATRAPQKRIGIFDNLGKDRQRNVKHPFGELMNFSSDSGSAPAESTDLPTHPPTYLPTPINTDSTVPAVKSEKNISVSPEKDFAKVPNSIKRLVEAGRFPNSSLVIYLYLYSLTRGAIQPKRSVRVNKSKLLSGSNLRSEKALIKNLAHLKNINLIKITVFNGDHSGNEFEVFVPEELEGNQPTHLPTNSPTYLANKSTPLPTDLTSVGRWVESVENKDAYADSKTSFKDIEKNDDEPFGAMLDILTEAFKKISGVAPRKSDREKWGELARLLVMELEIASARTSLVSNVPAFLTEHLRRRLTEKTIPGRPLKPKTKLTGESNSSAPGAWEYEAEPLSEEGREVVLKTFMDYVGKGQLDFILGFEQTYTKEDWLYLMENIK